MKYAIVLAALLAIVNGQTCPGPIRIQNYKDAHCTQPDAGYTLSADQAKDEADCADTGADSVKTTCSEKTFSQKMYMGSKTCDSSEAKNTYTFKYDFYVCKTMGDMSVMVTKA